MFEVLGHQLQFSQVCYISFEIDKSNMVVIAAILSPYKFEFHFFFVMKWTNSPMKGSSSKEALAYADFTLYNWMLICLVKKESDSLDVG